jgi:hypothetical protein
MKASAEHVFRFKLEGGLKELRILVAALERYTDNYSTEDEDETAQAMLTALREDTIPTCKKE